MAKPEKAKLNREKIKLKKEKVLTDADIMKYEIAEELGLLDKVNSTGWKSLTAKESGRIGGIMTKRRRAAANGSK
jgi:hypothetical protein